MNKRMVWIALAAPLTLGCGAQEGDEAGAAQEISAPAASEDAIEVPHVRNARAAMKRSWRASWKHRRNSLR